MNCRNAQSLLSAERDGPLEASERTRLDQHVSECAACRRMREELTAATATWRRVSSEVAIPDAEREWHALRHSIRNGGSASRVRTVIRLAGWGIPVAAAALLAAVFFTGKSPVADPASSLQRVAQVESVEVGDGRATPVVFLDQETGWLVVWSVAEEPAGKS